MIAFLVAATLPAASGLLTKAAVAVHNPGQNLPPFADFDQNLIVERDSLYETVMNYNIDDVKYRWIKDYYKPKYGCAPDDAYTARVAKEMLRWLFICGTNPEIKAAGGFNLGNAQDMDEMWHQFILFTLQYDKFCLSQFGRFIHHTPTGLHKTAEATKGLFKHHMGKGANAGPILDDIHPYIRFLKMYKETFGENAPVDIWPRHGVATPSDFLEAGVATIADVMQARM